MMQQPTAQNNAASVSQANPATQPVGPATLSPVSSPTSSVSCTVYNFVFSFAGGQMSFEDAENLINNLLLFDAFIFAFASNLTCSVWSHDDLLEADARAAMLYIGEGRNVEKILSRNFLNRGYSAMILLYASMILCLILTVSLNFSSARERQASLDRWVFVGRPVIFASYVLFFFGLVNFFWASHLSIEMMYPRYAANKDGKEIDDWEYYYNPDTESMITITGSYTNDPNWAGDYGLAHALSEVKRRTYEIMTWGMFWAGLALAISFNWIDFWMTQQGERSDENTEQKKYLSPEIRSKLEAAGISDLK
eukprot:3835565-Rhodomonas_salina.1